MKLFAKVEWRLYNKVWDIIDEFKKINYGKMTEEDYELHRRLKSRLAQIRRLEHGIFVMRYQ